MNLTYHLNNRVVRTVALAVSAVAVAVGAFLATLPFTPPASAAVSCSQAGTTLTVTLPTQDDKATFLRGPGREILVNGAQCGTATTENTETVTVTGADQYQHVYIDLAGGPFVSLQRETSPPNGTSVQFQVDLGGDEYDLVYIYGTSAVDTFVAGVNGITLDQTSPVGELDVVPTGIDFLLYGRGDNDFLSSSGDNTTGAPVADTLHVWLIGEAGNDTLVGGNNVEFWPGPGDDTMAGQNTAALVLASAPGPVKVDLAAGTATGEGNDTFSGVTGVSGSNFDDELIGNDADNYLGGYGGSDVIRGGAGDDQIVGSTGNDDLDGQTGSDTYPNSYTNGVADDDTIADSGVDTGDEDRVDFYGSAAPVSVDLAAGTATGLGQDTLAGIETVRGTEGADTLVGASAGETLLGMGGNDLLAGRGGADELQGGEGDDLLRPGAGNDTADGGPGANTLAFDEAPSGVNVSLAAGTASGDGTDTLAAIQRVRGSAFADTLVGSSGSETLMGLGGADTLAGGGGADLLQGGEGDDLLRPGAGNDKADGGPGVNTLAFDQAPKGVTVSVAAGTASGEGTDTFTAIRRVHGSAFADVLRGSGAADVLVGLGGADTLMGGPGADRLDGGRGRDTAAYASAPSAVTVDLAKRRAAGGAGADTLLGVENVLGSRYADVVRGSPGSNVLRGGSGADTLVGGAGADRLEGGRGRDTAAYASAPSAVTVDLAKRRAAGGAGADTVLGVENVVGSRYADVLLGSRWSNVLRGGGGRDTLRGAAGNDRLFGMSASDALYGAGGNDLLSGSTGGHDSCYQGRGAGRRIGCEHP
jgi:Ca2+-binding RTX toxin-like protein